MQRISESPPSTFPLCEKYLKDRGITLQTALNNGVVCRSSYGETRVLPGEYRQLLGTDHWNGVSLQTLVEESLWFFCRDHCGAEKSVMVRFSPELPPQNGEKPTKFITPRGEDSFPFVPRATWDVSEDIKHPIILTEGACKALSILQAGGLPIALSGVWMGTRKHDGKTELHKALRYFKWQGRVAYLAFDADFATKPDVRQALIRTGVLLIKAGADVRVMIWEAGDGNRNKGIDDLLYNEGPEMLASLCETARDIGGVVGCVDLAMVKGEMSLARVIGSQLEQLCGFFAPGLKVSSDTLLFELGGRARDEGDNYQEGPKPLRSMPSWIDYGVRDVDPALYHIGNGFMEIGGISMLIGQSYVGKSTFLTQVSIYAASTKIG